MYDLTQVEEKNIPPVGINEGWTFKEATVNTASSGNTFLKITFAFSNGSEISQFEFPVDMQRDYWEKALKGQLARVKHILKLYLPDSECAVSANSFEEFANKIAALLNAKADKAVVLRAKTVFNNRNFVSFPRYAPFLERAEEGKSRLKIDPKYDKLERSEPDSNESLLDTTSTASDTGSDEALPF